MGKKPAPSKPIQPKQPVRMPTMSKQSVSPVDDIVSDIASGSRALIDQGRAAGARIKSGVQKIKDFVR